MILIIIAWTVWEIFWAIWSSQNRLKSCNANRYPFLHPPTAYFGSEYFHISIFIHFMIFSFANFSWSMLSLSLKVLEVFLKERQKILGSFFCLAKSYIRGRNWPSQTRCDFWSSLRDIAFCLFFMSITFQRAGSTQTDLLNNANVNGSLKSLKYHQLPANKIFHSVDYSTMQLSSWQINCTFSATLPRQ